MSAWARLLSVVTGFFVLIVLSVIAFVALEIRACGPLGGFGNFDFDFGPPCPKSERAINVAAADGRIDEVRQLLDEGQSPTLPDGSGLTPIECAFGNPLTMELLLDRGADLATIENPAGRALTSDGCFRCDPGVNANNVKVLRVVLDHGADPNGDADHDAPIAELMSTSGRCGEQPGERAVHQGAIREAAELLIDHGADPSPGVAPAASSGFDDFIQLLALRGADLNAGEPTALVRAAFCGHRWTLNVLLELGADVNHVSSIDVGTLWALKSSLTEASEPATGTGAGDAARREAVADVLDSSLFDSSVQLDHLGSPLAAAIVGGHPGVVDQLLVAGARPDVGFDDLSPLQLAALVANEDACRRLADRGADINFSTENVPSAIDLARWYHQDDCVAALTSRAKR